VIILFVVELVVSSIWSSISIIVMISVICIWVLEVVRRWEKWSDWDISWQVISLWVIELILSNGYISFSSVDLILLSKDLFHALLFVRVSSDLLSSPLVSACDVSSLLSLANVLLPVDLMSQDSSLGDLNLLSVLSEVEEESRWGLVWSLHNRVGGATELDSLLEGHGDWVDVGVDWINMVERCRILSEVYCVTLS